MLWHRRRHARDETLSDFILFGVEAGGKGRAERRAGAAQGNYHGPFRSDFLAIKDY